MHMPSTKIVKSEIIGHGEDGLPLHRWAESDGREFEEKYVYLKAASGITYGCAQVFEIFTA